MSEKEIFTYLDSTNQEQSVVFKEDDFELKQMDVRLTDVKMKSKPTTFFKDALRRFTKNKSSVVGAVILGTILLLTLILPSAMTTNITISTSSMLQTYLPPKLFDSGTGFWDGTTKVSDMTVDFDWDAYDADGSYHGLPVSSNYEELGIKGGEAGITYSKVGERKTNTPLAYARGGDIRISAPYNARSESYALSYPIKMDLNAANYGIEIDTAEIGEDFEFGVAGLYTFSLDYYLDSGHVTPPTHKVTGVDITAADDVDTVGLGQTLQLTAHIEPENATNRALVWTSSDDTKITVSETGLVTGVALTSSIDPDTGDPVDTPVTITATAQDGSKKKDTIRLSVAELAPAAAVPVDSVTIHSADDLLSVEAGQTLQLRADVLPANASNNGIPWQLVDAFGEETTAATIDSFGNILASSKAEGLVAVATAMDGSGAHDEFVFDVTENAQKWTVPLAPAQREAGHFVFSLADNPDILANLTIPTDKKITAQLRTSLAVPTSGQNESVLLDRVMFTTDHPNASIQAEIAANCVTDANATLGIAPRNTDGTYNKYYWVNPVGSMSLYKADYVTGSFTYDAYEATYGVKMKTQISKKTMNQYKANGWLEFNDVDAFLDEYKSATASRKEELKTEFIASIRMTELGVEKSPLRVDEDHPVTLNIVANRRTASVEFNGYVSMYRYLGYEKAPRFLFGTDNKGRDMLRLVFNGLRVSFILGLVTALVNFTFGLVWGAISGYFGGWTDIFMERFCEILGGIPWIVVMTLILVNFRGNLSEITLLGIALCVTGWIGTAGLTRTQFYRFKDREYILASRSLGAKDLRLIFRHILPNAVGTIITSAVMMIPSVIFSEASLTFLSLLTSLGSFGFTLAKAQGELGLHPYILIFPSVIMALIMISFNLFGNGLRDAFNPSLKGGDS